MNLPKFAFCLALLTAANAPAFAQSNPADPLDRARYVIEKSDGGFVRLNRRTGQTSFCKVDQGNLICRMSADERAAYEAEIAALNTRLTTLEKQVAALKPQKPGENQAKQEKSGPSTGLDAPDDGKLEEEFDRAMEFAQDAMRRFFDVVKELKNKYENQP